MNAQLKGKIKESLFAVMPIFIIVLLLHFTTLVPLNDQLALFIVGSIILIFGMGLFTLGADIAMSPMGEQIGSAIIKKRNIFFIIGVIFIVGILITIAEPDLSILADQIPSINHWVLIIAVSVGVGIFFVISILRIVFKWSLSWCVIIAYAIVFILTIFTHPDYIAIGFDSGGVTTGPITVPFIIAIGVGVASVRGGKDSIDNSFGLVALCAIGPIMAVMFLGLFTKSSPVYTPDEISTASIFSQFANGFLSYGIDVTIALAPIIALFFIFQFTILHLPKHKLIKMIIGMVYTYIGLILFLTAVNVGFMPASKHIGEFLGTSNYSYLLIPIGAIIGFFIVLAEPTVHVLNKQVEEISGGMISKRTMLIGLTVGTAFSVGLSMLRIVIGFNILYYLIPGYAIAIILSFFVPKIYTAIAFDSGGVASGPMSAGFILPFAVGACGALHPESIMQVGFGIVAMITMTPLITIQVLGLRAEIKVKVRQRIEAKHALANDEQIIYFGGISNEEN